MLLSRKFLMKIASCSKVKINLYFLLLTKAHRLNFLDVSFILYYIWWLVSIPQDPLLCDNS
jgi:hypothetical protein